MAEADAVPDLSKVVCMFCLNVDGLQDPKSLPCSHIYCLKCVTCYYQDNEIIRCPLCRGNFDETPQSLPSAYQVAVVDDSILCDVCTKKGLENKPAITYCTVCSKLYCAKHQHAHDDLNEEHSKMNITMYKLQSKKLVARYCTEHADTPYSMGCRACLKPICVKCISSGGTCTNGSAHQVLTLDELVEELTAVDQIQDKENKLEDLFKLMSNIIADFDTETKALLQMLHKQRDHQLETIQQKYAKLENELLKSRGKTISDMDDFMEEDVGVKLSGVCMIRMKLEAQLAHNHQVDIISGYAEMKGRIQELLSEVIPKLELPDMISTLEVKVEKRDVEIKVVSAGSGCVSLERGLVITPPPLLITPHTTFMADNDDDGSERGLDFNMICQEGGIIESIPQNVLDSLEKLCRKYWVEFATFEQDPNDSKHILILGVNALNIPEEEVVKALPDASFKVRRQNSNGPLHTTMLSMEYALSIEKKEWENAVWTRIEKASCQLLVKANQKNKDKPNENGSSFAIGPAHLILKNEQARVVLAGVNKSQVAREEVERLTTSNRYIIKVDETETSLFDFNYPVLLSYRYWCRATKDAKCDSCRQLSQGERSDLSFCRHMIMNDMVLLPLERPSADSLQAQLAKELGFTVGPIFPIINIGRLKKLEQSRTAIWVGKARGELRPCNPKAGDFIGYHLQFILTSKDAQGVTHELENGDCGSIVFCKEEEKEYLPLGMFIGKSRAEFDAPVYQAILLDEAIKDIEKEYPHHVEGVKLYQLQQT